MRYGLYALHRGDGWFGWALTPEAARRNVDQLTTLRAESPRAGQPLIVTVVPDRLPTVAMARDYAEAGVDRLVLLPSEMTGAATEALIDHVGSTLIGVD